MSTASAMASLMAVVRGRLPYVQGAPPQTSPLPFLSPGMMVLPFARMMMCYAYGVMRVLCDRRGLPCERLGMPACVLWLPLLPRPCRCSVTLSYGYCHGSGAPEGELLFADLAPPAAPNP